jgi:hypothetical protein
MSNELNEVEIKPIGDGNGAIGDVSIPNFTSTQILSDIINSTRHAEKITNWTYQDLHTFFFENSKVNSLFQRQGCLLPYNENVNYFINAFVIDDTTGNIYKSLIDDNKNNLLNDITKWEIQGNLNLINQFLISFNEANKLLKLNEFGKIPTTILPADIEYKLPLLSNNIATPNTQLDYSAGFVRGMAENIAGTIDFETNGADGLDTGSIAVLTWYYIYAIYNPTLDITKAIASLDNVSPLLPSGYTTYKYIGAVRTNASGFILKFSHNKDNYFEYNAPIQSYTNNSIPNTRTAITIDVPPNTRARMNCVGSNARNAGTGFYGIIFSNLNLPEHTLDKLRSNISWAGQETFDFMVNENSQIGIRRTDPSFPQPLIVVTEGYYDLNI